MNNAFDGNYTDSNFKFFEEKFGTLFLGGPVCNFEGMEIPIMVRYSEKEVLQI